MKARGHIVQPLSQVMDIRREVRIREPIVTVSLTDGLFTAKGSAKAIAPDKFDPDFGIRLATARALQRLARKQERDELASARFGMLTE